MKISPKKKVLELTGKPAKNNDIIMTYGFVLSYVLTISRTCDPLLAYRIMVNCNKEEDFDLSQKHVDILKEELIKFSKSEGIRPFNNIVIGQIVGFLDGEDFGVVEQIEPESKEPKGDESTLQPTGEKAIQD